MTHGWLYFAKQQSKSCFPRFYDYWNAFRSDIEANETLWSVGLRKRSLELKTAVSSLQFFFVLVLLSSKDVLTLPNHLVILFFQSIECSSIQGDVRQLENRQVFKGKVLQAYSCVVLLWL